MMVARRAVGDFAHAMGRSALLRELAATALSLVGMAAILLAFAVMMKG